MRFMFDADDSRGTGHAQRLGVVASGMANPGRPSPP